MKNNEAVIAIFGAGGFLGKFLTGQLAKLDYRIKIAANPHLKGYLKPLGNPGQIELFKTTNIFNPEDVKQVLKNCDFAINLIGILYEKNKGNSFENIHTIFPSLISKICKEYNVQQFIQLSALGIDDAVDSNYAKSKLEGEKNIKNNFKHATILRPSVVYSVDDNFTTNFMTLLNRLFVFPLYYNGDTKFMPIYCSDLTEIIYQAISKNIISKTIECIGPETISLKDILKRLLKLTEKKRLLIPLPLFLAKLSAIFFQLLPNPLLTLDQLKLLRYNNVASGKYKTNFDIGIPSVCIFDVEVEKYAFMWKESGQFSRKKNNLN